MNSFQQTIKQAMLSFPTLYKEKWQVCSHIFASNGNGCSWLEDGTMYNPEYDNSRTTMKLENERVYDRVQKEMPNYIIDSDRRALMDCHDDVEEALAKIREKYIDSIARNRCCDFFMNRETRLTKLGFYMEDPSYPGKYENYEARLPAFCWPENIHPDWAEGLLDFINFWIENLDNLGQHQKNYKPLRAALAESQNKLNIKVHGKSTEQLMKERMILSKRLIAGIIAEEKKNP